MGLLLRYMTYWKAHIFVRLTASRPTSLRPLSVFFLKTIPSDGTSREAVSLETRLWQRFPVDEVGGLEPSSP